MTHRSQRLGVLVALATAACATAMWAQESPKRGGADEADKTPIAAGKDPGTAEPKNAAAQDVRTPSQPSPEDIIRAFQRDRPVNAPVRPTPLQGALEPAPVSATLLREGEYLNNLAGRLSRDGSWWTFVFESDSPDALRPPMRLLPNQQVERLVRETEASRESLTFVVSGEVTLFESENYLLLRKALRRRTMGNLVK